MRTARAERENQQEPHCPGSCTEIRTTLRHPKPERVSLVEQRTPLNKKRTWFGWTSRSVREQEVKQTLSKSSVRCAETSGAPGRACSGAERSWTRPSSSSPPPSPSFSSPPSKKRVWRTRKANKASSWTTSPPRSERTTCSTGAVLTVRTPGEESSVPVGLRTARFSCTPLWHWPSSVSVGRRAAPPLFAHCGEASRPVPSRRSSVHVAAMSGAVAPAASQRLQSRHPHATTRQQLEFQEKCDSACCPEPERLVVMVVLTMCNDNVPVDIAARVQLIQAAEHLGVRLPASPPPTNPRQLTAVSHRGLPKTLLLKRPNGGKVTARCKGLMKAMSRQISQLKHRLEKSRACNQPKGTQHEVHLNHQNQRTNHCCWRRRARPHTQESRTESTSRAEYHLHVEDTFQSTQSDAEQVSAVEPALREESARPRDLRSAFTQEVRASRRTPS